MIWLIAKKDFLLNLISVRFTIGFLLCLLVIPFTLIVSVDGYLDQMRIYRVEADKAAESWKNIREYSVLRPIVVKQPTALSIFSKGIEENIGTSVKINFGEKALFLKGKNDTRENQFLNAFFSIDFSMVIAILISLLALVFSYDAITREREDGTMKLMFTSRLSRISFLFGKLAGLLLTLLPILIFCYLLGCLVVVTNPGVTFSAADWGGIFLLFLTSIVYMLVFILLGMLISSLTYHSSTSIIVNLLFWVGFLFLIPRVSCYIAQNVVKVTLYENVQNVIDELDHEMKNVIGEQQRNSRYARGLTNQCTFGDDGYLRIYGCSRQTAVNQMFLNEWKEPFRIGYADKKWAVQKKYLDELVRQQRYQQYLSWLSPSELFRQSTWKLCRTDAGSYLDYMESVRNYRETLIDYFKNKKLFGSLLYFTSIPLEKFSTDEEILYNRTYDESWNPNNYPALELNDVPRYAYNDYSLLPVVRDTMGRVAALLGLAVALLLFTVVSFMKYDIR